MADPLPTADAWLAAFGEAIGVAPPDPEAIETLLDLAGVAAHSSERRAAPIACFMVAMAGLDPETAIERARAVDA